MPCVSPDPIWNIFLLILHSLFKSTIIFLWLQMKHWQIYFCSKVRIVKSKSILSLIYSELNLLSHFLCLLYSFIQMKGSSFYLSVKILSKSINDSSFSLPHRVSRSYPYYCFAYFSVKNPSVIPCFFQDNIWTIKCF